MRWKDFLYFQRKSKIGVILLLILILLTLLLNMFLSFHRSSDVILIQNDSLVREFEEFRRSLSIRQPNASTSFPGSGLVSEKRTFGNISKAQEDIIRQDESGNTYSQKSSKNGDIRNVNANNDNISFNENGSIRKGEVAHSQTSYPFTTKLSIGATILLNSADTTEWKKVPGIGSAYASRIVKYRDLLGGFVHMEQLLEVYGIDQDLYTRISPYIEPDGEYIKLQINKLEFGELLRHPYLNYKQVQAILSLRRRKGGIASIRELSMLNEFTSEDIIRLEPYLGF